MKRLAIGLLATLLTPVLAAACSSSGQGSIAKFCEIAGTSSEARDALGIMDYYKTLEAAAPEEIKEEVATLRTGWMEVEFPLSQAVEGQIADITRPAEVSEAARKVYSFVGGACGEEGGVYLSNPEIGF